MGRVICITSGKGGVGKTFLCANVAAELARGGVRVLCVDCSVGARDLDMVLGVSDRALYHLSDAVTGRCDPMTAIIPHPEISCLSVLPAPQYYSPQDFEGGAPQRLIDALRDEFDVILLDGASGLDARAGIAMEVCDGAIIVVEPTPSSIRMADFAASRLMQAGKREMRIVVNRIDPVAMKKGLCPNVDNIIDSLSIGIIGAVPARAAYMTARAGFTSERTPFANIAARLCSRHVPLMRFNRVNQW